MSALADSPHPSWAEARLLWDCCKDSYEKVPQMVPDKTDPAWEEIAKNPFVQVGAPILA
jgi:hypothetical protein